MDLNKDNMKKIRGLILFTILVLVAVWNYELLYSGIQTIWRIILPFAVGGAIAFIINVPMHFLEDKLFGKGKKAGKKWTQKLARPISLVLAILFVWGIVILVMFVVIPELGRTVISLGKALQDFFPEVKNWAIDIFHNHPELVEYIKGINFDWDKIGESLLSFFKSGAGTVLDSTYTAAKSLINGVTTFFIAFVFSCYILLQKEKLGIQIQKLMYAFLPKDWTQILLALCSLTSKSFSNFVTGQCLEAIILGMIFLVMMSIFQMPYALLISVLIGFTALIPIFGAFIGCAIGALLIFIVNPVQAFWFIVMFLILQQLEGNFIYPHVVGNSVGLPSIWVLVAVSIGASLMGVVGMLIFIPIVSVIYTMLRGIVNRRLKEREVHIEN